MDAQLRARLAEAVGAGALTVDAGAVAPRTTEEVAAVCRACAAAGTRISVVSGPAGGAPPPGADLTLALGRLDGLRVDRGAMVLRAGAGTTLESLRTAAGAAATALVGMPSAGVGGLATRAGSLVARGQVPRRALTGIVAVLPTGEVVRAGGGVLKDVTGYDLAGVLLGSMGRLAVITELGFRLQPHGARAPAAEAPPGATGAVSDLLRQAFDPGGLLVAGRPDSPGR